MYRFKRGARRWLVATFKADAIGAGTPVPIISVASIIAAIALAVFE